MTWCIISLLFFTKCHLFYNFIFLWSSNWGGQSPLRVYHTKGKKNWSSSTFFINHVLKFIYLPWLLQVWMWSNNCSSSFCISTWLITWPCSSYCLAVTPCGLESSNVSVQCEQNSHSLKAGKLKQFNFALACMHLSCTLFLSPRCYSGTDTR